MNTDALNLHRLLAGNLNCGKKKLHKISISLAEQPDLKKKNPISFAKEPYFFCKVS